MYLKNEQIKLTTSENPGASRFLKRRVIKQNSDILLNVVIKRIIQKTPTKILLVKNNFNKYYL